jgi:hypothetical protein
MELRALLQPNSSQMKVINTVDIKCALGLKDIEMILIKCVSPKYIECLILNFDNINVR